MNRGPSLYREVPVTYIVYEFSYPQEMPGGLAGIVFYVGMADNTFRLDDHLFIAAGHRKKGYDSANSQVIRSIWDAGLVVVRKIVYETLSKSDAETKEGDLIKFHQLSYLTNTYKLKRKSPESLPTPPETIEPVQEKPPLVIPVYRGPRKKKSN
jgi:hypothetical protein